MTRDAKAMLALPTFWPLAHVVLIFANCILLIIGTAAFPVPIRLQDLAMVRMVPLNCLTGTVGYTMMFVYLLHVFASRTVRPFDKLLWALGLIFLMPIAVPVYWYYRVWREPEAEANGERPT